jgi:hypothetical protein
LLADLTDAPHQHVLDGGGVNACLIHESIEDLPSEIDGMPAGEASVAPAACGALGRDDECFSHDAFSPV